MKPPLYRLLAFLFAGFVGTASADIAPDMLMFPHPAEDREPVITPDGRWLLFTSERDGMSSIKVADLRAQRPVLRNLVDTPAREHSPAISPNGRWAAFVSTREDALGDVFLIRFPDGTPRKLTQRGVIADSPLFPANESLYYRTETVAGESSWWRHNVRTGTTAEDAPPPFAPAPPYEIAAIDRLGGAALLYTDDTNHDGMLGPGDKPTAWELVDGKWRQATPPIRGATGIARHPVAGDLYISAQWTVHQDIGRLGGNPLRDGTPPEELLRRGRFLLRGDSSLRARAISWFSAAHRRAEDPEVRNAAAIELVKALNQEERFWQASSTAEAILADQPGELTELKVRVQYLRARYELAQDREDTGAAPMPAEDLGGAYRDLYRRFRELGETEEAAEVLYALASMHAHDDSYTEALGRIDDILEFPEADVSEGLRNRALLFRADIYTAMGLGTELEETLLRIFANGTEDRGILEGTSERLIQLVRGRARDREGQVIVLRDLAARARDYPYLLAKTRLAEGRLLRSMGDYTEAISALRDAAWQLPDAPVPSSDAAIELAGVLADQGNFEEAVAVLRTADRQFNEHPTRSRMMQARTLRSEVVRYYVRKGRSEMLLGDPLLALSTYRELLEFDDTAVEGWRGLIDAASYQQWYLDELIDRFSAERRTSDDPAMAWYRYGLALSYRDPYSRNALRAVERAIELDPSVPYFYLTNGFLLEQQFRRDEERGRADYGYMERAALAYEQAFALVPEGNLPELRADLMLNSGNAAFLLQRYHTAANYYRQRAASPVSFADRRTSFLFRWNYGMAAFRGGNPPLADEQFRQALSQLDALQRDRIIDTERAEGIRLELIGRRALALMESERNAQAREVFEEVERRSPGHSLARARAVRNQAILAERMARAAQGIERARLLREAENLAEKARTLLENPRLQPDHDYTPGGGLASMQIVFSADVVGGGSLVGFERDDEERIIYATLGRIAQLRGEHARALALLARQKSLEPRIDDTNRPYYYGARSVTLSRMSEEALRLQEPREALQYTLDGLAISRFTVAHETIVDGNAATRHLLRTAEMALAAGTRPDLARRDAFWMLEDREYRETEGLPWQRLAIAAKKLTKLPDPIMYDPNILIAATAAEQARLYMVKALAREQIFHEETQRASEQQGLRSVEALTGAWGEAGRALDAAEMLQTLAARQDANAETFRLGALGFGTRLRLAAAMDSGPGQERLLEEARAFLTRTGQQHLEWWMAAQLAIHCPEEQDRVAYTEMALRSLEATPVRSIADSDPIPWDIIAHLETLQLRHAAESGDAEALWEITERWRAVRLGWLAEGGDPIGAHERDEVWLREYRTALTNYRRTAEELRGLPFTSGARANLLERQEQQQARLHEHILAGRQNLLPSALYFHPIAAGFETVSVLLQPPFIFEEAPILALNRDLPGLQLRAVYTPEESRLLEGDESLPREGRLFVFGEEGSGVPEHAVMILDSLSFYTKFEQLSFNPAGEPVRFPGEDAERVPPRLAAAYELDVTRPVRTVGRHPQFWMVDGTPVTLLELLAPGANLERLVLPFVYPDRTSRSEQSAKRLAAAAWFHQHGLIQAVMDGAPWLGVPLTPEEVPQLAAAERDAAMGRLEAALDSGRPELITPALERIILIKEALGETAELPPFYVELAQTRARMGRFVDASRAGARRVELLEELYGLDSDEVAQALPWRAGLAAQAREWDTAQDTYSRAAALLETRGERDELLAVWRDQAIALENAGRFTEAYELAAKVREEAMAENPRLACEQALRMARIARIYLNRYANAERLLFAALEEARNQGFADLELDAMLNLARVTMAVADFEASEEWLEDAMELAEAQASEEKIAEVILERANVFWYRSEYFESFREQQNALDIAERIDSLPLKVAIRNVSGLTSWAVNDLDRAHEQLGRALQDAEEMGVRAEIASTANNIGLVYRAAEEYEDALRWFNRARDIDEEEGNRWGEAYALRNIAITHTVSGSPERALEPLDRAIDLARTIGDEVNLTKALLALGDALEALQRHEEAMQHYEDALESARMLPLPEVEWRALYGMAQIHLQANRQGEAAQVLGEAIEVVDNLRASIRIEEFQDGFLLDKQDLYNTMIALQLDRLEIEAALETSERSRGRNFIDLLGNRRLNLRDSADEQQLRREEELRRRIEHLEREAGSDTRPGLAGQLEQARRDYTDFLIQLRTQNPELSDFISVDPMELEELRSLIEPETRLVIYHVLPEELVIFVLGRQTLRHYRMPIGSAELEEKILATRRSLQNFEPVDAQLFELSRHLVEPVLPALEGVRRIGVIPHRQLHTLPFAALPAGPEGDLIDRVAIFYAPSASVLRYTMARRDRAADLEAALAVGNPDLGDPSYDLPFAQKEAERLRFTFPRLELRTGSEATETWLVENLPNYAIIHIASHGEYSPDMPLFSAVMLAADDVNDGTLTAQDVFGLELRADLVALSACQTGLGRVSNGDDIVGLGRAFVYAGTRQLLTTLWRVDDISTAVLFKYFYRNIEEMDRAEALRQAQIRLKNRPEYVHPAHWAGLVLTGDWQ